MLKAILDRLIRTALKTVISYERINNVLCLKCFIYGVVFVFMKSRKII